jgi:hypothetical protein
MTWYDQIPTEDGVSAYVPKVVYSVLNQKYMSSFETEKNAKDCSMPVKPPIDVATLRGANQGGEPVLISAQDGDQSFCIHLRSARSEGEIEAGHIDIFCMKDRVERREWLDYLKDAIKTERSGDAARSISSSSSPPAPPPAMFGQAPRTICEGQLCLTNSPQVHDNQMESSSTADTDDVKLMSMTWLTSFPIAPSKAQEWSVEKSAGSSSKVNICHASGKCLAVLNQMHTSGLVPLPARKFIDCPGGNLKCFNMEHVKVGMTPSTTDTDMCKAECDKEKLCHGWVYTRPLATGTGFAKCCMKKRDMSVTCGANRCCDAHMSSETTHGTYVVDGSQVPLVPDSVKMVAYAESDVYQQWTVVPESSSVTRAKLQMNSLCLVGDPTTSANLLTMDSCENGMVFNFEGFADRSSETTKDQ